MAEKKDPFALATEASSKVRTLEGEIKVRQIELKTAKADLIKHRKAVLDALGRKPRAPRKAKPAPIPEVGAELSDDRVS